MFLFCGSMWQCIDRGRKLTAMFKPFKMKCIGSVQQNLKEILIGVLMKKISKSGLINLK